MMIPLLFLTLASSLASPGTGCADRDNTKLMCPGRTFIAEKTNSYCDKTLKPCLKEALSQCASGKIKTADCTHQYGGIWMTVCTCD